MHLKNILFERDLLLRRTFNFYIDIIDRIKYVGRLEMSNVQILVACMHQKDDSLYKEMNLQTDIAFDCY